MEFIDKAAVVAEIENKIKKYTIRGEESDFLQDGNAKYWGGVLSCLNEIRSYLDTLEAKEVDLDDYYHKFLEKEWFGLKQSSSDEYKIGESEIYLEDDGGEPPYDGKQWLDISCMEYAIPYDKFKVGDKIEIVIRKIKKGE